MAKVDSELYNSATSLKSTILDYRASDGLAAPDEAYILEWLDQFNETRTTKRAFLEELSVVFSKIYHPLERVRSALKEILHHEPLVGSDPKSFWRKANLLEIQLAGTSQYDLNKILKSMIKTEFDLKPSECGSAGGTNIYLDDAIYSGNRVVKDLEGWMDLDCLPKKLVFIVLAAHSSGVFRLKQWIKEKSSNALVPQIYSFSAFKNKRNEGGYTDVLRLRGYPQDLDSQQYLLNKLNGGPAALLRSPSEVNQSKLFSSEQSRAILEGVLWRAGLKAIDQCPNLTPNIRPLGYCSSGSQNKLGFGSLFVTYRNCPNNAPVALWANEPWTPLFPRNTNT